MSLTDVAVRTAKPASKPRKIFDERGLFLLIHPSGGKSWKLTFEAVAFEYIDKREAEGLAMATLVKSNWLAKVLCKSISHRPIAQAMKVRKWAREPSSSICHGSEQSVQSAFGMVLASDLGSQPGWEQDAHQAIDIGQ